MKGKTTRAGVAMALLLLLLAGAAGQSRKRTQQLEEDISGTYSFLQEGEFVQIDVQEGKVGGFVSRYGTGESDKGSFLDHFMKDGTLKGDQLSWETQPVHGVWYTFQGRVERGEAKSKAQEGYYVLRGTLTEYTTDAEKKVSARAHEVAFKSFPEEEEEEKKPPGDW